MPSPNQTEQIIFDCLSIAEHSESTKSRINALQTLSSLTKVSSHNRTLLSRIPTAVPTIASLAASSQSSSVSSLALSVLFNLSLNPILKNPLASLPNLLNKLNTLILPPHSSKTAASLICSLAMLDKNKAVLGVSGTVQSLVQSINQENQIMHYLLSSLAELVKFRGNSTLAVRAGAVPALVRLVRREDDEFAGSASGILGVVVGATEEGVEAVRKEEGVVEVMMEGMRNGCMVTKENAAGIMVRMFEDGEEVVGTEEFVALVADVAVRGSTKAREKAGELMRIVMELNAEEEEEEEEEEENILFMDGEDM